MKVTQPNPASLASAGANPAGATKAQETTPSNPGAYASSTPGQGPGAADDVHLSELVRSLRSLAASPERQARIEQIARSYASGTYQADPQATASKVVDEALKR